MAIKGLSYMVAGAYAVSQGAVTYTGGKVLGKAVSYSITLDTPQRNDLYGDNEIAESDNQTFTTGQIALNPTDFAPEVMAWMMGQTAASKTVGSDTVTVYNYDDDMSPIQAGVGLIELHQVDNEDQYQAVILTRVQFQIPGDSATTKGETVSWQTPTINADIYRDETAKRCWRIDSEFFDTEAEAKAFLNSVFGISA